MKKVVIAAVAKNGVIGNGNQLPWDIPEDMKFFRDSTRGQIVVMGRKTLDSLGKVLPKRENAVVTRNVDLSVDGARIFHDLQSAFEFYGRQADPFVGQTLFVIGGAQLYHEALKEVDEVWLTEIHQDFQGDVFFPFYEKGAFLRSEFEMFQSLPQADSQSPYRYHFNRYRRKKQ